MNNRVVKPSLSIVGVPANLARYFQTIKLSLDALTGSSTGELKGLKKSASNEEIIEKINELIARLNASGEAK